MKKGMIAIPKTVSRLKENFLSQKINLSEQQINVIDSLNEDKRFTLGWVNDQFKETLNF